ncbi:MAG: toprim domain-containing protein [Paracoccaceae bacterium]
MIDAAQLTRDLGGIWHRSYGTAPCPVCQSERRKDQNALSIRTDDDRLLMNCKKSGCDFRDILVASGIRPGHVEIDQMAFANAERERRKDEAIKLKRARGIWDQGQPIHGTKGETYLRERGITCPLPDTLRWLPDTYHQPSGRYRAAMIANVSTGGVHRTFFDKKTGERLTRSNKMMLGPCQGGSVALTATIVGSLVICEGIETGLSLASGFLSSPATVWAALSTSGIKGLRLPNHPGKLVVASDGDGPGQAAGRDLASRAHALGWEVSLLPAPNGHDWNDVLTKKGVGA